MAKFNVVGPLAVKLGRGKNTPYMGQKEAKEFWQNTKNYKFSSLSGCYILAMRAAKGYRPFYVGKATKNFEKETFAPHKLTKIARALADTKKGTLVLFLVLLEKTAGPTNNIAIDEVETYLIQSALVANKRLLNDRKTKTESWSIRGVFKSGQGKPSSSAAELKKALKL